MGDRTAADEAKRADPLTRAYRRQVLDRLALAGCGRYGGRPIVPGLLPLSKRAVAELLGVRAEAVSRWARREVTVPLAIAFTLGELYLRPRVVRKQLEQLGALA